MTLSPVVVADPPPATMAVHRTRGVDLAPLIAGCLVFALVLFLPQLLNDGDTFWQIATGGWILDHHAIPTTDPFSFTAGNRHWFAHEWLAETLMALAFRAAGLQGVMALAAATTGLTAAVLLRHLRRFLPGIYAVAGLIVALGNAAPSMLARPHLLAWPCLTIWCCGLLTARANRTAPAWWLLPVMILWVNLHGSFMVGLLLPGAFMIEALFDPEADRRDGLVTWLRFIAAAWLVALINPEGLSGVLFPIHMLGMKSLAWIGEWEPTSFAALQPLEIVILGCIALGFSGKLTLPPIRLLILLGLIHGALTHARNEQLLGIVGVLILAQPIGTALSRRPAKTPGVDVSRHRSGPGYVAAGAVLIAILALPLRLALPLSPERTGATFAAMLGAVPPALRERPVLNEYGLGGRLIFNGIHPFIDSRADLYGDAFLARYRRIAAGDRAELARALSEYAIAWTIFPATEAIVPVLDTLPGWKRLLTADGIVIHVRNEH